EGQARGDDVPRADPAAQICRAPVQSDAGGAGELLDQAPGDAQRAGEDLLHGPAGVLRRDRVTRPAGAGIPGSRGTGGTTTRRTAHFELTLWVSSPFRPPTPASVRTAVQRGRHGR